MPGSEEYLASLGFDTSDVDKAVNQTITLLGQLNNQFDGIGRHTGAAERALSKIGGSGKDAAAGVEAASGAANKGSKAWQDYQKSLADANTAYKEFRAGQVTGEGGGKGLSEYNDAQVKQFAATSEAANDTIIGAIRKREREQKATLDRVAADEKRVANYSAQQWVEAEERKVAESRRAADLSARLWIEAEEKRIRAAETARQGAMAGNATRARTTFDGGINTRLGQEPTGLKAADTTFAKDMIAEEKAAVAARKALADHDAQINKGTASISARSTGLAQMLRAEEASTQGIVAARYALYDQATTYGLIGASALAAAGGAIKMGADFESAFTNVERTGESAGASVAGLRSELVDMSTEIPRSFDEITQIATLGNQLGVAEQDLTSFTGTVSRFGTVTGLTAEASATAFGAIGELLNVSADEYENLGSAIALVGRRSVATEAEIVTMTQRLAASATRAGLTKQEVVALSGAFASLRIAPERAQGVMETYFNVLNTAVATGGERLEAFAQVSGMTTQQVQELVRTDPTQFFTQFSAGLGSMDVESQTLALDALGLSGLRAGEVFGRVSSNMNVFVQSLADSNAGWSDGSELARQYGLVLDDLNSQLMILWQSIQALIASGGGEFIPGLAGAVGHAAALVNNFRGFIESDFGGALAAIGGALTIVIGLWFTYQGATSLATASTYALITAQSALAGKNIQGGIMGLIGVITGLGNTAQTSAGKVIVLRNAFVALLRATVVLGLLAAGTELIFNFGGSMEWLYGVLQGAANGLISLGTYFTDLANKVVSSTNPLISFGKTVATVLGFGAKVTGLSVDLLSQPIKGLADWSNKGKKPVNDLYGAVEQLNMGFEDQAPQQYAGGLGDVGSGASDAAAEVRTLADYASDLSGVFSRAFDIRFGGGQALDTITTSWRSISDATDEARKKAAEYRNEMLKIRADMQVRQYWLSVAENYGDELRAAQLRAELAELNKELTDTQKDLSTEQDKTNKTLVGNSAAAVTNRGEILGLVGGYQEYLTALASSGVSQAELAAESQRLKNEFITQATQMGYNRSEVDKYARAFDGMTLAIQKVPRNITVTANADPALQAINEFMAKARSATAGGVNVPVTSSFDSSGAEKAGRAIKIQQEIARIQALPPTKQTFDAIDRLLAKLQSGNYYNGGFTGNYGKREPVGVVHGREFVMDADTTAAAGGPRGMEALRHMIHTGISPQVRYAPSEGGSRYSGPMDLSEASLDALAARLSWRVDVGGQPIAQAAGAYNSSRSGRRG